MIAITRIVFLYLIERETIKKHDIIIPIVLVALSLSIRNHFSNTENVMIIIIAVKSKCL